MTGRRAMSPGAASLVLAATLLVVGCASPRPVVRSAPAGIGAEARGLASWYGHPYHGRRTASGEVYDMHQLTAAHRTLPFGTWLLVENLDNGRTVRVRVNDRGPTIEERILDLSYAAARALGALGPGVIPVRLRIVGGPPGAASAGQTPAYSVQLGAFSELERATALRRELEAANVESTVRQAGDDSRPLYRVRAGRFGDRDDAERLARHLSALGYTTIVVSE